MRVGSLSARVLLVFASLVSVSALADDTTNYTYDALGRLVQVSNSGTVNNGLISAYNYDPAGNRSNVTVATPPPSISISDVSGSEGSSLSFTITRTGVSSTNISVTYSTVDGSAVAGSDYSAAMATVTFAPADPSTKTIIVNTIDDAAVEGAENFFVDLTAVTGGAAVADGRGVGTINDNDTPPPSFAISDGVAVEGGNLVFTVTKTGSTSTSFSLNYATADGSAVAGSDYTSASGTITFAASDTSKSITISTIDDAGVEGAETVLVNLSGATGGATIGDAQGTGTINDNDSQPCNGVSFTVTSNAAVTEGVDSSYTVTKSGTASGSCAVNYATANGTATSGADYTAASGTLTFTSAQAAQTLTIATVDDSVVESAETFSMSLSSPTGGAVVGTPGSATATINDNDAAATCGNVSFSVNDVANDEGFPLDFTITKTGTSSGSCSVNYATANGTAVTPSDYTAASGTLTFASNVTTLTVSVTTLVNGPGEADETMSLNLSGATGGATITDSQGIGTLFNYIDEGGGCPLC